MSDDPPGSKKPSTRPGAGRSGTASSIGAELGGDLDFEPDALLDSLFDDVIQEEPPEASKPVELSDPPAAEEEAPASMPGPKLHEPRVREFPADEVTFTGSIEAITSDDPTPKPDKVDPEKTPLPPTGAPNIPAAARPPGGPPRPSVPGAGRPAALPPRPGAPSAPRPRAPVPDGTAEPPAVNPSGPPTREPFPPAASPAAPVATRPSTAGPARRPAGDDRPKADPLGRTIQAADPLGKTFSGVPDPPTAAGLGPTKTTSPGIGSASDRASVEVEAQSMRLSDLGVDADALEDATPRPADDVDALMDDVGSPSVVDPLEFEGIDPEELGMEELDGDELGAEPIDDEIAEPEGGFEAAEPSPEGAPMPDDQATVLGAAAEVEARRSAAMAPSDSASEEAPESERPANAHLADLGVAEEFMARAEWLESEAEAASDPAVKARLMLVASELWAMNEVGDRARAAATGASKLWTQSVEAQRQARALATADGDWKAVSTLCESETRVAASAEARAHATYVGAEVQRLHVHDEAAAQRKLDKISRLLAADPRPGVARLATQLATAAVPKMRWPDEPDLAPLAAATADLVRRRGGPTPADAPPPGPSAAFETARRAFAADDSAAAGQAVANLAEVKGLDRAARWLAAALLTPSPATRPRAIELLRELLESGDDPAVRRSLAARALEEGDGAAVEAATVSEDPDAPEAFTAADRVALGALTGSAEAAVPSIASIAKDETLRPLAAAAVSAAIPASAVPPVLPGDEAAQAAVRLGRSLVAAEAKTAVPAAMETFEATHSGHALGRVLGLETALGRGDADHVASALSGWPGETETSERDGKLAAALVYELAQDAESARPEYTAALGADGAGEAPARALLATLGPPQSGDLMASVARRQEDASARALLLVEAAHRKGQSDPGYVGLLEEAADSDPALPFAVALGELSARARGDASSLLDWLRRRREAASDPVERALDLVREALLTADDDLESAASLLGEATEARPGDIALRELHERLAPDADGGGQWREATAAEADDAVKGRLLLEAALEFERSGDLEGAARASAAAVEAGGGDFALAVADRTAAHGPKGPELSDQLMTRAKEETDPERQREIYERLCELDEARGDGASARLWRSAILESSPTHLPSLRQLEHEFLGAGRGDDVEKVAAQLAELLDEREALAHARLAARFRTKNSTWAEARPLVDLAAKREKPPLWALRAWAAHSRAAGADADALSAHLELAARTDRELDGATLRLRAAEAAARLGKLDEAKELLDRSVELAPSHMVALTTRAEVLEALGDFTGAAEAFESVARTSAVEAHRLQAWFQSAVLWLDNAEDEARGMQALEHATNLDVTHEEAFGRLQALYVKADERIKLAELLERRLAETTDPNERIALEVTRGKALADVGEADAAKEALQAALDANPDNVEALDAFAELCIAQEAWEDAEQAWIRLARHVQEPERQAEIYRKLADLYDTNLPNPSRAELSYKEVLKRQPNDTGAMQRLVQVYGKLGQTDKAIELQTDLVNKAQNPDEKRERMIGLAVAYEQIAGDKRKAETTLEKARKAWPTHATTLKALAEFYQRSGENAAVGVLLDRAANDARRALNTGRFDPSFFEALATVAELRGNLDAASIARATLGALRGEAVDIAGAGVAAGGIKLDDLVAPDLLSPPFRALLKKAGAALDAAYPMDLRTLRASPMPAEAAEVASQFKQVAAALGVQNLDIYVSSAIGPVCMPVSTSPPQIVFGKDVLESDDDAVRSFLFVRAVKILQAHGAALARTAPIDLWPVTAAFLRTFAPSWQPQGVDARKLAEAQQRIQAAVPSQVDPDVGVLALEVTGSIGNRASQLATAIHELGNRAGLLAIGDPNAAIRGVALSGGHTKGVPTEGSDRLKWIVRNPEARDLAVFSVSDAYAQARGALGLAG